VYVLYFDGQVNGTTTGRRNADVTLYDGARELTHVIQQGLTQDDYSVTGAMVAVATIAALQVGTSYVGFRSQWAAKVLEGLPMVLVDRGKHVEENLRRERISEDELGRRDARSADRVVR